MAVEFVNFTRDEFLSKYENIYRFVPLHRFLEIFQKNALTFVYLGLWNDPFEKLFLEADYAIDDKPFELPIKNRLYSMCWSRTRESEAFWTTYISHDNGVRIKSKGQVLLETLDRFSEETAYRVFIGQVRYLEMDELMHYRSNWDFVDALNTKTINEAHIELMLLKRRPFEYEDEIRILLYPDAKRKTQIYDLTIDPKRILSGYMLDPRMEEPIANMIKEYFMSTYEVSLKKSRLYEKKHIKINVKRS